MTETKEEVVDAQDLPPFFEDLVQKALKKFPGAEIHDDGLPPLAGKIALPFPQFTSEIQRLVADKGLVRMKSTGDTVLVTDPIREMLEKHPGATIHVDAPASAKGVPLATAVKG